MRFEDWDASLPLTNQLGATHAGPVVLVNKFTVALEDRDALLAAWAADAAFMRRQPGFIWTQLHRGIGDSGVFLNYAVWESLDAFKNAFGQPEFRSHVARYPASAATAPCLFEKVAVPGICVK